MSERAKDFTRIYRNRVWGDKHTGDENRSGTNATWRFAWPLALLLSDLRLRLMDEYGAIASPVKVLDLGCGDLLMWRKWVPWWHDPTLVNYHGVDIVPDAIEKAREESPFHSYTNSDIIDFMRASQTADILLVSDVLFHLANEEINELLEGIRGGSFRYVVLADSWKNVGKRDLGKINDKREPRGGKGRYAKLRLQSRPFNLRPSFIVPRVNGGKYNVFEGGLK